MSKALLVSSFELDQNLVDSKARFNEGRITGHLVALSDYAQSLFSPRLILFVQPILSVPTPLLAKGKTVKITIKGADLKRPIEISDPKIPANFQVWTGPGTSTADRQGLIIDWPPGPVREPPQALRRCQVSLHTDPNDQIVYVVYYAFSLGAEQGHVYVPGESDEWYGLNVRSIIHGVEGKWFRAWSAWERVARPLIQKAELTDSIRAR